MVSARKLARIGQAFLQVVGACAILYVMLYGIPSQSERTVELIALNTAAAPVLPPPPPVVGCTDAQMAEARAMLAAYVSSIEQPGAKFRHGFTPAEYAAFPCTHLAGGANAPTRVDTDIVFVMIASSKEQERAIAHRQTWAGHANMLMFADVNGTEAGFIAHPEANGPAYGDAQHRTLRGLQYAVKKFPNARCVHTRDLAVHFIIVSILEAAFALMVNVFSQVVCDD